MAGKLTDYTKRRKENPKKSIFKCPLCDKFGRMVEIESGYVRFIHTEKVLLLKPIPYDYHDMPKVFLEQYKDLDKKK